MSETRPDDRPGRLRGGVRWLRAHPRWTAAGVLLGVAGVVFVLVWFQPQKLFFDQTVDEAFPVASTTPTTTTTEPPSTTVAPGTDATTTTAPAAATTTTTMPAPTTTTTTEPPGPELIAGGDFIDVGHEGDGRADLYRLPDGSLVLRFEDLDVSNGPDLRVILSPSPLVDDRDAYDDGDFLDLGVLKGNVGNQNYEITGDVDLSDYATVAIWCRRFNYTFNAAPLTPAGS
jgi:hypothetical protein